MIVVPSDTAPWKGGESEGGNSHKDSERAGKGERRGLKDGKRLMSSEEMTGSGMSFGEGEEEDGLKEKMPGEYSDGARAIECLDLGVSEGWREGR